MWGEAGGSLSREIFQESLDKTPCDVALRRGCLQAGVCQGSLAGGGCLSAEGGPSNPSGYLPGLHFIA